MVLMENNINLNLTGTDYRPIHSLWILRDVKEYLCYYLENLFLEQNEKEVVRELIQ